MLRKTKDGVVVAVRLQPGASGDEILGPERRADDAVFLKVRVKAVPEKGRANKALCALLAKSFGLPKAKIEVISGPKSRIKSVLIRAPAEEIEAKLKDFS